MKKLLILLTIVPIVLLSISVFASSNIATNEAEVINYLHDEIDKGSSVIEVTYKNSTPLSEGTGLNMFKEAIKDFEYLKNNYSRVVFNAARVNGDIILKWTITYRTTPEQEVIINNYVAKEGTIIKNTTSNQAEQVKLVNKLVKSKNVYSEYGISTGTAYGAVVDGKVVCHGYTMLSERLLTYLGIENKIVIGYDKKGTKHSWNIVNIDNNWYHVDVTYNDTNKLAEGFLLKSDVYMSSTRSWDYYGYPRAEGDYSKPVLYVKADSPIKTDVKVDQPVSEEPANEEPYIEEQPASEVVESKPHIVKPIVPTSTWMESFYEKAINYGIVPNGMVNSTVTREDFVEIIMAIYSKFGSDVTPTKTFSDTTNIQILKAYELGITSGVSTTTFAPNRTITREQAAVMIYKLLEIFNIIYPITNNNIIDINQVSSWAVTPVKFVNYVGIMNGTSTNYMNPQGSLKSEEAYALAVATYEYIK